MNSFSFLDTLQKKALYIMAIIYFPACFVYFFSATDTIILYNDAVKYSDSVNLTNSTIVDKTLHVTLKNTSAYTIEKVIITCVVTDIFSHTTFGTVDIMGPIKPGSEITGITHELTEYPRHLWDGDGKKIKMEYISLVECKNHASYIKDA